MAYDYDVENLKALRHAPTARIRVCKYVAIPGGFSIIPIFSLTSDDLISVMLDLRSVETKLDNPELQASTIEIEAYWDGTKADLQHMTNSNVAIEYRVDGAEYRTFFATISNDTVSVKNKILKIKGTDLVGTITGQNRGLLVDHNYQYGQSGQNTIHVSDLINNYLYKIVNEFNIGFYGFSYGNLSDDGAPDLIVPASSFKDYIFVDDKSKRKCIAQFMNMFRGSDPDNPDSFVKRFVFRDAGQPAVGWCANGIANFDGGDGSYRPIRTFEIGYGDVSNFNVELGKSVKAVRINNPDCDRSNTLDRLAEFVLSQGERWIVSNEEPYAAYSFTTSNNTILTKNAYTLIGVTSVAQTVTVDGYRLIINRKGDDENPDTEITTSNDDGEIITLEEFIGLKEFTGLTTVKPVVKALTLALTDCNLANPKWIEFTWRGDARMQPRDIILFTEEDGSRNYYEIDNLTLDHKDGGMTSKVKAIYKFAYTGEE